MIGNKRLYYTFQLPKVWWVGWSPTQDPVHLPRITCVWQSQPSQKHPPQQNTTSMGKLPGLEAFWATWARMGRRLWLLLHQFSLNYNALLVCSNKSRAKIRQVERVGPPSLSQDNLQHGCHAHGKPLAQPVQTTLLTLQDSHITCLLSQEWLQFKRQQRWYQSHVKGDGIWGCKATKWNMQQKNKATTTRSRARARTTKAMHHTLYRSSYR